MDREVIEYFKDGVSYDIETAPLIYIKDGKFMQHVLDVRGWGNIQNLPEFKGNLEAAAKFQDEIGKFVVEAINEKLAKAKENDPLSNIKKFIGNSNYHYQKQYVDDQTAWSAPVKLTKSRFEMLKDLSITKVKIINLNTKEETIYTF